jgi:hypothetical protein
MSGSCLSETMPQPLAAILTLNGCGLAAANITGEGGNSEAKTHGGNLGMRPQAAGGMVAARFTLG